MSETNNTPLGRVIDGRLYRETRTRGDLVLLDLDDSANAKWKEGLSHAVNEVPHDAGLPTLPDGLYRRVWRKCEQPHCWHGYLKEVNPGSSGIIEHGPCPACANNVRVGGRYELERCEDD